MLAVSGAKWSGRRNFELTVRAFDKIELTNQDQLNLGPIPIFESPTRKRGKTSAGVTAPAEWQAEFVRASSLADASGFQKRGASPKTS
jgi:hypothetical protein